MKAAKKKAKNKAKNKAKKKSKTKSGRKPRGGNDPEPLRLAVRKVKDLERELAKAGVDEKRIRWNADPDDVQRSVVKLVLTLVELLRKLMERQAIRRMENGTLTDEEVERVGTALMKLEETLVDLAKRFDLSPEELNLELGPLGKLH